MELWQILAFVLAAFDLLILIRYWRVYWRTLDLGANGTTEQLLFPVGVIVPNGVTAADRPIMNLLRFYPATGICTAGLISVGLKIPAIPDIAGIDGPLAAAAILGTISMWLPSRLGRYAGAIESALSGHPPIDQRNRGV